MKVIDLLNKIANGEEAPKKIKFNNIYCYYRECKNEYVDYTNKPILNWDWIVMNNLNGEVEILEEEKKIPEKLNVEKDEDGRIDGIYMGSQEIEERKTINSIIDYLKRKGE